MVRYEGVAGGGCGAEEEDVLGVHMRRCWYKRCVELLLLWQRDGVPRCFVRRCEVTSGW